jgi:hypothetical protein
MSNITNAGSFDSGDEPVNPFDPVALRADPSDDDIDTKRIAHRINVRKPTKTEFFRVHPDDEYTTIVYMIEVGEGLDTEKFIVVPALARESIEETTVRRLFTCVNRAGKPFIWPAKIPTPSNSSNSWLTTALDIAESAKRYWVRMIPDLGQRLYEESRAEDLLAEPKWPELTFTQMLELGFKNKLITDYDHEVLRTLRGEL